MKWVSLFLIVALLCFGTEVFAQCSLCTKTAAQLGEKPAKGLNSGIVYLMLTPFIIVGILVYRWMKGRQEA